MKIAPITTSALIVLSMALTSFGSIGSAEETVKEKAKATTNTVKRNAKKGWHKTKEMVCAESDAECLALKAKHRAEEAGDYVEDKAEETKDKID
ncbi:MAG: hypothetical protein AB7F86_04615 [Bdellovibrionales bacterium]